MKSKILTHPILLALSPLLLVGALLFLVSCIGTTSGTETGNQINLQGKVLGKDNTPVAGVTVRLAKTGLRDTTDFQGRYHILKDTSVAIQSGVLDTLVFLQDNQRVAELEVTQWVETFPDVKLIQRNVRGLFTITDPGISRVEAVLTGTGIPQGHPVVAEFFYNKPVQEYSGFLNFRPGGSTSKFAVYINVYDVKGLLIGRSDSLYFNGLAGDITIPAFDPGNARKPGWFLEANLQEIKNVYFPDINTGWAIRRVDYILCKTSDGGTSWAAQGISARQVQFFGPDTGWALEWSGDADTLYKTFDGGSSWVAIDISPVASFDNFEASAFQFINRDTGWVVGRGQIIMKTTDGGSTWVIQSPYVEFGLDYGWVQFIDGQTGWANNGYLSRTTNGGATWTKLNFSALDVHFANAHLGLAVTFSSGLARTTDGGVTWTPIKGVPDSLNSVRFINADTAWAVGNYGIILITTDGGITWDRQSGGTNQYLWSIFFVNANTGWVGGSQGTFKTTTGGKPL